MHNSLSAFGHLLGISLRTMIKRKWVSITSILSVTLVILILIGFLAMAKGFEHALYNTGSDEIAIMISPDAETEINSVIEREQYELLKNAPGIRKDESGEPVLSAELTVVVGGNQRSDGKKVNFNLRGLAPDRVTLREGFELTEGRMFSEGAAELIVGQKVAHDIDGLALGNTVRFGSVNWKIVGVFSLQGKLFESEVWANVATVQGNFNRQNQYQSVRALLENDQSLIDLAIYNASDPRLELIVQSEREYFARQSGGFVNLITYVGWPLAIILSFGAFTGILNSMRISVESRRRELIILNQIGFRQGFIFLSIIFETLVFSVIGAIIGIAISFWLLDGVFASTFGASFDTLSYALQVDWATAVKAFLFALAIGLLSGLLPAMDSRGGRP